MKKKLRGTACAAAVLFLGIILSVLMPVESSGQKDGKDESFANVVVFVRFADSPTENFLEDKDNLTDMYGYGTRTERARKFFQNTSYAGSLPSYLEAVSYGQFHVKSILPQDDGTKIIPYTLSKGFSEYQNNSSLGEYEIVAELLESGSLSIDSGVILDYNGDGCVDNLTVVMDTTGRTVSDKDGIAYPHKANFDGSQTLNGRYIRAYNVLNVNTAFDDAGTICHEFLHSIGYPDLYVGDDANTERPVGGWDIMASSMAPLRFPLAYMRSAVSGWLTIDTLKESGNVTLAPATASNGSQAYILKTDQSELEFFVVEYRVKGNPIDASYDLRVPGTGLIVYRINTRVERLSNITGEYGVYVHRYDDGSFSQVQLNNLEHSVFVDGDTIGNGDMTKGASAGAIVYSDGSNSGITIDGIVTNEDGTVSFDVHYGDTESLDLWKKDAASVPECSSAMMDMVQAPDGTIYMLYKSGNAYRVSSLKNGVWEQVGDILKDGNEPCITLYEGCPAVSLMDSAYKKQSLFIYQNGSWKEVSLSAPDFWNKASIVGTDFGLFSVVTGSDNALTVYCYQAETGSLKEYMKNLIPSSENPVQVHLMPGEGAFYLGYRAFGDGELLKSVKINKDGTVLKSSSGFACEDLTMARSDNGHLYILARQKGKAEAALFQYDDSSWKGLDSFPIGKSVSDMSLLIRDGVPYAAVRSDGQSGTDGKTAVFYRSSDGVWSQLGYYAGNEAPEFAFLYSDEEYIKLVFSYGSGNGGSLTEHKYHSLAPNGGKVEETSQPSSSEEETTAPETKPTEPSGTQPETKPTQPLVPPETKPTEEDKPKLPTVSYKTHVQSYGWLNWASNGQMSGTSGESKRMEAVQIRLSGNADVGVRYKTHVQTYGWLDWVSDGQISGTSGEAKRLEAIQIQLTGKNADDFDVYYRVHAQSYGWLGWAKNGASSGTAGYGKRLEAIEICIVRKGERSPGNTENSFIEKTADVSYQTHVQSYGWQGFVQNGELSGTTGEAKRLEGIRIIISNSSGISGGISYSTHVQSYGWQGDVRDGAMSGTSGQAKRLEAIKIQLTGGLSGMYDIYYRVHAQSFGWLGWAKNGAPAGTAGYAKRLEGIQIKLVPKGGASPGEIRTPYIEK